MGPRLASGEALQITGPDVSEQNLALRFDSDVGTWTLIGDAAKFALGETRRTILEAVKEHGSLTPKEASGLIEVDYNLAKVTMCECPTMAGLWRPRVGTSSRTLLLR